MRESVRYSRISTGFAALAALFIYGIGNASAQDTSSFMGDRGYLAYDRGNEDPLLSEVDRYAFLNRGNSTTTETPAESQNVESATQSPDTEGTTETITVTALRTENLNPYGDPDEFDETILDRMGVESTPNPDLEGLPLILRTSEENEDDGWAINVPVFGSRRGETGPFISVGAGRPENLVTGGWRF